MLVGPNVLDAQKFATELSRRTPDFPMYWEIPNPPLLSVEGQDERPVNQNGRKWELGSGRSEG
jgi:hypothetical protein